MPLTPWRCGALAACALFVAGCGSPSYQDSARSATGKMKDVIQTFNTSHQHDVASTGEACRKAYDDLGSQAAALNASSPPAQYRAEAAQLRSAYTRARSGFQLCATSASHMNFAGMVTADGQIAAANTSITRARALEH